MVVLAAAHCLADRDHVAFAELQNEPFITGPRTHNPEWLAEQQRPGLPGRVAAEAASVQEVLTLVASARGVCLVPAPAARLYPRADVRYVKVTDADPAVVSLAWRNESLRPIVSAFIDTVREVARSPDSSNHAPACGGLSSMLVPSRRPRATPSHRGSPRRARTPAQTGHRRRECHPEPRPETPPWDQTRSASPRAAARHRRRPRRSRPERWSDSTSTRRSRRRLGLQDPRRGRTGATGNRSSALPVLGEGLQWRWIAAPG